jgi:hypothetical protein
MLDLVARQFLKHALQMVIAGRVEKGDQGGHALGLRDAGLRHHLVGQLLLRAQIARTEEEQTRLRGRHLGLSGPKESAQRSVANLIGRGARRQVHQRGGSPGGLHPLRERGEPQRRASLHPVAHRPHLGDQRATRVYQINGPW